MLLAGRPPAACDVPIIAMQYFLVLGCKMLANWHCFALTIVCSVASSIALVVPLPIAEYAQERYMPTTSHRHHKIVQSMKGLEIKGGFHSESQQLHTLPEQGGRPAQWKTMLDLKASCCTSNKPLQWNKIHFLNGTALSWECQPVDHFCQKYWPKG